MSERQIETMLPIVEQSLRVGPDGSPAACGMIEALAATGEHVWIQVLAGTVNMLYPFEDDPLERLRRVGVRSPLGLELIETSAREFATFSVPDSTSRFVAFFVDRLFVLVLGCEDEAYDPRGSVEALGP